MIKKGFNQDSNKIDNKRLVLKILNKKVAASRIELAKLTGLTKATITNIINGLLDEGLVSEVGSIDTACGRRPTLIEINPKAYSLVGLYIARDYYEVITADFRGYIIDKSRYPFKIDSTTVHVVESILGSLRLALTGLNTPVLGIGITSIGPLDTSRTTILSPSEFHDWHDIPIRKLIEKEFGYPVFLENDCNASVLAEKMLGNWKDIDEMIYIGIENGVGSGIITGGELYKGSDGFGAEIGHMTVAVNGERCSCGNIGCLEYYLTLPKVVNRVRDVYNLGGLKKPVTEIDWKWIVDSAINGDDICMKAIQYMVPYLSAGIVNAVNIFDPTVIILGHDLIFAGDIILEPLTRDVNERFLARRYKEVKICISTFGNEAPVMGSIALLLNNFYNMS